MTASEHPGAAATASQATVRRRAERGAQRRPISVVLPTYNERENVEHVIQRCRAALSDRRSEIVVVDDNSPDGTWRVVRQAYGGDDQVTVIRRTDERGLATAISDGLNEASHEFCAVLDADLQHPPEKLPDLLDAFGPDVDVVIGSRYVDGGGVENWSLSRRAVSRGATVIAKVALPSARGVDDPLSGFFAVRRDVLDGVDLAPIGYKILLELLVTCEYEGVVEVPYVFSERERGVSKLSAREYVRFLEHVAGLCADDLGLRGRYSK